MNIKKLGIYSIPALALSLPVVASAQTLGDVLTTIGNLISQLLPILIGIAMLVFIWGLIKYVAAKDDESQKAARGIMLYGVLALFVIVAIWGLVRLLQNTLGITDVETLDPPGIPGLDSSS